MSGEFQTMRLSDIKDKNICLFGNHAEQLSTCRSIVDMWDADGNDDMLLVLDRGGDFYSSFGEKGKLIDLKSIESVMPDILGAVFSSPSLGGSLDSVSEYLSAIFTEAYPNNAKSIDPFWKDSGKLASNEFIKCGAMLAKYAKFNNTAEPNKGFSMTLEFASHTESLLESMRCVSSTEDPPKWEDDERILLLGKISPKECAPNKIFGILQPSGKHGSCTTVRCIYQCFITDSASLIALFKKIAKEKTLLERLPLLDLVEFAKGGGAKTFFLCSTGNAKCDNGLAILTIVACAAAAERAGKKLTLLAPNFGYWNIYSKLEQIRACFEKTFFAIIPMFDVSSSSYKAGYQADEFLRILEESCELTIWHHSQDEMLKTFFDGRGTPNNKLYTLSQINGNLVILDDRGGNLIYKTHDEPYLSGRVALTRSPIPGELLGDDALWINQVDGYIPDKVPSVPDKKEVVRCDGFDLDLAGFECELDDDEDFLEYDPDAIENEPEDIEISKNILKRYGDKKRMRR